jgi:hypothetical protein
MCIIVVFRSERSNTSSERIVGRTWVTAATQTRLSDRVRKDLRTVSVVDNPQSTCTPDLRCSFVPVVGPIPMTLRRIRVRRNGRNRRWTDRPTNALRTNGVLYRTCLYVTRISLHVVGGAEI